MATVVPIDIEPYLTRHLQKTLMACGFLVVGEQCEAFMRLLQGFARQISRKFNAELQARLQEPTNTHSKEELVSWAVSELCALQAIALQRFERRIVD